MSDVAIVVGTLDLYKDVWPGLAHGMRRYWPDCPFKIKWITNRLDAPVGETIKVGGDHTNWAGRIERGLSRIKEPIILWMIGDHWIARRPDVEAVMDFIDLVRTGRAHQLRLYPGLDHDFGNVYKADPRLIVLDKKSPYRCSCKPSIWNRRIFLDLLKLGESPWDFERNGRGRSAKHIFMTTKDHHWFFVTQRDPTGPWAKSPVVKGRWTTAAKRYAEMEGLEMDFGNHPVKKNPFGKDVPDWILL